MEQCFPDSYTDWNHRGYYDDSGDCFVDSPSSNEAQQILDVRGSRVDRTVYSGKSISVPAGLMDSNDPGVPHYAYISVGVSLRNRNFRIEPERYRPVSTENWTGNAAQRIRVSDYRS